IQDGPVRDGGAVRGAGGLELDGRAAVEAVRELVEQARLADAGVALDQDRAALPLRGAPEGFPEVSELLLAPDQRGQPALLRHLQAGAAAVLPRERVSADGSRLSLDLEFPEILEREESGAQVLRGLAHHDLAGTGDRQEAGCQV